MEAIILAGGYGTRLKGLVDKVPKPMIDINGKPFLSILLNYLNSQGFKKIIFSVHYKYEIIKNFFKNEYNGILIDYCIENEPLGTGGAIRKSLKKTENENVFILNGDTFFKIDFRGMWIKHNKLKPNITIALKLLTKIDRYGVLELENDKIIGFKEKNHIESGYINGGIYLVNKDLMCFLNSYPSKFSFEKDFLQKNINNINVIGYVSSEYFIDIGIPEDMNKAKKELY